MREKKKKTTAKTKHEGKNIRFGSVFSSNQELFRDWEKEETDSFAGLFEYKTVSSGAILLPAERSSEWFYFLLEGNCEEFTKASSGEELMIRRLGPNSHFGEAGFFHWKEGKFGVRAETDCKLLRISSKHWKKWEAEHPETSKRWKERLETKRFFRMASYEPSHKELLAFISNIELLFHIDHRKIGELLPYLRWLYVPGGERLMLQGEPGNSLFVILSGRFRYTVADEQGNITGEGEFAKGDIIGEMSLLTGEPRSASVYAVRSSQVIQISRNGFRKFISDSPEALFHVTETIARRLGQRNKESYRFSRKVHTIALVPVTEGFPLRHFSNELSKSLKSFGSTLSVNEEKLSKSLKEKKIYQKNGIRFGIPDILSWFGELEKEYDNVVFEVDPSGDPLWTEASLRQADRILLLTETGRPILKNSYSWNLIQGESLSETMKESLVYLEDSFTRWEELETLLHELPGQKLILRKNRAGEFDRIARRLEGKSVGIALAGGGAKGFAHLGFLRSLSEAGVPIDIIGGTSAGSIMAGLFAMGYGFDECIRLIKEVWIEAKLTRDYTLPFVSILRGARYSKAIKEFFGNRKIETLWIPFLAVACDLTNSKPKVFEEGEVWKAIRASTSIPGIFPPFYSDGSLYVDGGLWDNLPGTLVRRKGADVLFSVDLGAGSQPNKDQTYGQLVESRFPGEAPSALKLLGNQFMKKEQRYSYPHIGELFMRSMLLSSRNNLIKTKENSDIFVELPVRDFSTFDWDEYKTLYELGYEHSQKFVKDWAKIIKDKVYSEKRKN
ncbi:cyclic nucleotide-binding protein [Leptospira semungkisensis]|uniref:Cyclic nucleotide-binding protein n=1 Tax=Leptospira semungkisensis TaxID=2484985 RepID=A0A4R9G2P5_9LEPT|nr:patatin-like phospholipase family protein [Leptospira semungkisensis]TGK04877.1 cyclic nucleotide-binding protein [Leptospira semungkisensis]